MGIRTNTAVWVEKTGRWQIKVQKDGIRRTFNSSKPGREGQRECNAKADAWLDDGIDNRPQTVNKLYPEFLEDIKLRGGDGYYRNEEYRWRVLIQPLLGRVRVDALNDGQLQRVIDKSYRRVVDGQEKVLSKKSMMSLRASLCAFVRYLRKYKYTTYHPEDLTIPKGCRTVGKTVLHPKHLKILFSVDTTLDHKKRVFDRYIYAYRFQLLKGLRPGELIGLMWSDIDGDILRVQRSVNVSKQITTGKNDNAKRALFLTKDDQEILELQRKISKSLYIFDINSEHTYYHCWQRYCQSNDIPKMSLYEIRHSFVSVAKQLPDGLMRPIIGHSKDMDTWGTYSHEISGDLKEAATVVSSSLRALIDSVPDEISDEKNVSES